MKWRKRKFLNQSAKLKCHERNFKNSCEYEMPQKYIFFAWNLANYNFLEESFLFSGWRKNRPENAHRKSQTETERALNKIIFKTRVSRLKREDFT